MARKRRMKKTDSHEVTGFYVKVPVPPEVLDIASKANQLLNDSTDLLDAASSFLKKLKG